MITPEERMNKAKLLGDLNQSKQISNSQYIKSMIDLEVAYMNQYYGCSNSSEDIFMAIALEALLNTLKNRIAAADLSELYEKIKKGCVAINFGTLMHGQE